MNDSAANADRYRLRAISSAVFFHDVLDVDLHRLFRDKQPVCNVRTACAPTHKEITNADLLAFVKGERAATA